MFVKVYFRVKRFAHNSFDTFRYISQVPYAVQVDDKHFGPNSPIQLESRGSLKRSISLSQLLCAQDPITNMLAHFKSTY